MDFQLLSIFIAISVVLISVTLHEAMHAFASSWLGDDTAYHSGRLTLNPIAHIDPFMTLLLPIGLFILGLPVFGAAKPVPFNPYRLKYGEWGPAIIAIAGPLTNLVLAVVSGIWLRFIDIDNQELLNILQLFIQINLGFFVFNMIPIPPLDGSRILYAIGPESLKNIMSAIERKGLLVIFAIILLFNNLIIGIVGGAMGVLYTVITGDSLL